MEFEGKNYLVIGGSSGIGLAAARRLSGLGARLVLASSRKEKLGQAVESLSGRGNLSCCVDLREPQMVGSIFRFLAENGICLDGMVYSAGIAPLSLLRDHSPELVQEVFSVNFFSFLEAVRLFQQETCSNDGSRIVAVSSITARGAGNRQILYGASKSAMISAVKLMSRELMQREIYINCVSPGVTNTAMLDDLRQNSNNLDAKIRCSQPLGIIPPEKVAETIVFLLSGASDYLTGMEWVYDGGALLK